MAGLGRVQQRFNAAVAKVLTLAGFARMAGAKGAQETAAQGYGHPIHAKYLRTVNPWKATGRRRNGGQVFQTNNGGWA